ncbi:unnamed protein product [Rhizoctonia solani]|uniref:Uncharacterized protein n=1 Tax=Rhizoctonia solani TaxID=456999 RepID=A0A8H3D7R9_9AGAM|nr:unnamed protein product [Rhizoctonia solani]
MPLGGIGSLGGSLMGFDPLTSARDPDSNFGDSQDSDIPPSVNSAISSLSLVSLLASNRDVSIAYGVRGVVPVSNRLAPTLNPRTALIRHKDIGSANLDTIPLKPILKTSRSNGATKSVTFSTTNSQVFFADDWDRSAVEVTCKLDYSDILELKQVHVPSPPTDHHVSMELSTLLSQVSLVRCPSTCDAPRNSGPFTELCITSPPPPLDSKHDASSLVVPNQSLITSPLSKANDLRRVPTPPLSPSPSNAGQSASVSMKCASSRIASESLPESTSTEVSVPLTAPVPLRRPPRMNFMGTLPKPGSESPSSILSDSSIFSAGSSTDTGSMTDILSPQEPITQAEMVPCVHRFLAASVKERKSLTSIPQAREDGLGRSLPRLSLPPVSGSTPKTELAPSLLPSIVPTNNPRSMIRISGGRTLLPSSKSIQPTRVSLPRAAPLPTVAHPTLTSLSGEPLHGNPPLGDMGGEYSQPGLDICSHGFVARPPLSEASVLPVGAGPLLTTPLSPSPHSQTASRTPLSLGGAVGVLSPEVNTKSILERPPIIPHPNFASLRVLPTSITISEGLKHIRFNGSGHIGHYFLSPSTNAITPFLQRKSLVTIDLVGYSYELSQYPRQVSTGDERGSRVPMPPEDPEMVKAAKMATTIQDKIRYYSTFPLPTTIDNLQEGRPKVNDGKLKESSPGPSRQSEVFDPWEIGDLTERARYRPGPDHVGWNSQSGSGRKDWHRLGTHLPARQESVGPLTPCRCCPKLRRPSRRKRLELKPCLAVSPRSQPPSGGPGGHRGQLDFSDLLRGLGGFPDNSDLTNGDSFSGQCQGSGLLQGQETRSESFGEWLDSIQPTPSIPLFQPHYYPADNLSVQQPPNAPSPPIPLSPNSQPDARDPGWNPIGIAASAPIPQPQYDDGGNSTTQRPPNVPPSSSLHSVNTQLDGHGSELDTGFAAGCKWFEKGGSMSRPPGRSSEWYIGFFDGCMFASRMSGGLSARTTRAQADSTRSSAESAVHSASTTVVPNEAQSFLTTAEPDESIVISLSSHSSQGSSSRTADPQPQAQPGPSTPRTVAHDNLSNGELGLAISKHYD